MHNYGHRICGSGSVSVHIIGYIIWLIIVAYQILLVGLANRISQT